MTAHVPLRLPRDRYFDEVPTFAVDRDGRVIDRNLAARVLLEDGGAPLMDGAPPPASTAEFLAALLERRSSSMPCRSSQFGRLNLSRRSSAIHDPDGGEARGSWVVVTPQVVERLDLYRERLAAARRKAVVWESYARSYDRILPLLPFYRTALERHVATMTRPDVRNLVDVGAGTGNVALTVAATGRSVTAVEPTRPMLERLLGKLAATGPLPVTVLEQSGEDLSALADGTFDGVTILLVLYDATRPAQVLREAVRVLRPGGWLIVTEPRRGFRIEPLLREAERMLRAGGEWERLRPDWERVMNANVELTPERAPDRRFAEDVQEWLVWSGVDVVDVQDSHLGQCATITAQVAEHRGMRGTV